MIEFGNGDIFTGTFSKGLVVNSSYGEYKWKSGASYKGMFENGCRHGNGIWSKDDKEDETYEGDYRFDRKNGRGVYR